MSSKYTVTECQGLLWHSLVASEDASKNNTTFELGLGNQSGIWERFEHDFGPSLIEVDIYFDSTYSRELFYRLDSQSESTTVHVDFEHPTAPTLTEYKATWSFDPNNTDVYVINPKKTKVKVQLKKDVNLYKSTINGIPHYLCKNTKGSNMFRPEVLPVNRDLDDPTLVTASQLSDVFESVERWLDGLD